MLSPACSCVKGALQVLPQDSVKKLVFLFRVSTGVQFYTVCTKISTHSWLYFFCQEDARWRRLFWCWTSTSCFTLFLVCSIDARQTCKILLKDPQRAQREAAEIQSCPFGTEMEGSVDFYTSCLPLVYLASKLPLPCTLLLSATRLTQLSSCHCNEPKVQDPQTSLKENKYLAQNNNECGS